MDSLKVGLGLFLFAALILYGFGFFEGTASFAEHHRCRPRDLMEKYSLWTPGCLLGKILATPTKAEELRRLRCAELFRGDGEDFLLFCD